MRTFRNDIVPLIRETGRYATPPSICPHPARNGIATTLRLNWSMLRAFLTSGMAAKRGNFSWDSWVDYAGRPWVDIERLGGTIEVEGFNQLAHANLPVVYAANHMSMLETVTLPPLLLLYGRVGIVLKKQLLDVPIAGCAFKTKPIVALGRDNPREDLVKVLKEGTEILKSGVSLLIFPQGTRRSVFRPRQFNSIAVKLAEKSGVPVVPIALQCNILGVGKYTKDFGPVDITKPMRFSCGKPMSVDKGSAKDVQKHCTDFIAGKLRQWQFPVEDGE